MVSKTSEAADHRGSSDKRVHLTERWLSSYRLPAGAARERWWDDRQTGFGVLVGRRWRSYFVARRVGSAWRYTTLGHHGRANPDRGVWTLTKARKRAQELLGRMQGGVDPHAEQRARAGGPTLREGLEQHVERMRDGRNRRQRPCSPRSIHTIETEIPRLLGKWMDRPLAALTPAVLQAELTRIAEQTTVRAGAVNPPGRALTNRLLAQVSAIWTSMERAHDDLPRNPARRIGLAAIKPRDERIPDGGFVAWAAKVEALSSPVRRELHLMALFTGLRSESLRHLRWDDVDEERGLIHVSRAKGGRTYTIPLLDTHREILERLRAGRPALLGELGVADDGGWLFPTRTRLNPPRVVPLVEPAAAGLPGLHALRRTYNSVAAEVGIAQGDREALMGHAASGVNARHYTRPEDWTHLAACAERVEAGLWARIRSTAPARGRRRPR